jgi:CDP-glycerol glycerophosphotransferase
MKRKLKKLTYTIRRYGKAAFKYCTNKAIRSRTNYAKAYKKNTVQDNIIFYETVHGASMTGNPYALFKQLFTMEERNFIHVWSVRNRATFDTKGYELYDHVKFVDYNSEAYIDYLTRAKYLINDSTFPAYFIKKTGQVYLNTWHGTPLKTMGKDMKGLLSEGKNVQRNLLQTDYLLAPNKHTEEILTQAYDIHDIYPGKVIAEGYPRIDALFNTDKAAFKRVVLGKAVRLHPDKKIVLYAPTWRGTLGQETDVLTDLQRITTAILQTLPSTHQLILKVHPFAYQFLHDAPELQAMCVPAGIDVNEVLAVTDVLITDYSSIFFDFYVTHNPIILFAYDYEQYVAERGLYFDLEALGVDVAFTMETFISLLRATLQTNKRPTYEKQITTYCGKNLTGTATARIIDIVFNGSEHSYDVYDIRNNKTNVIVFGGGLWHNGITTSFINLTQTIDYAKFNLILITIPHLKRRQIQNIKQLHPKVHIFYRAGGMSITLAEYFIYALSVRQYRQPVRLRARIAELYAREFTRLFGSVRRDVVIDYSGYAPFWAQLVAYSQGAKKIMFLHNDMAAESSVKYQRNLYIIFRLYEAFDVLACVGRKTLAVNQQKLTQFVDKEKFYYMPNSINAANVLKQAAAFDNEPERLCREVIEADSPDEEQVIVEFPAPRQDGTVFITVGRLAPEKDHAKLIAAFHKLFTVHPGYKAGVQLYIVGSGKLEEELRQQVVSCGLEHEIIFTGQLANPFPLMARSDVYISSSNHEGQPMVLLEALVLDKPIIATNIEGHISTLGATHGMLVANTIDGLYIGIVDYLTKGARLTQRFDVFAYEKDVKERFETLCLTQNMKDEETQRVA